MFKDVLSIFTIVFLGVISTATWLVVILNPLWFRERWMNLYHKSDLALCNPILAMNLF
jgi:hypothetical protein